MATTGVPNALYESSDAPDLVSGAFATHTHTVDINTNLSNITPQTVTDFEVVGGTVASNSRVYDVVSHDVRVTKTVFDPMTGDSESPLTCIGLNGHIKINSSAMPAQDSPIYLLDVAFSEDFNPGGTTQGPISVLALSPSAHYCGVGFLYNTLSDLTGYTGGTFNAVRCLIQLFSPPSGSAASALTDIYFY